MSITNTYESISNENRKFPPTASFAESAHIGSMESYYKQYHKSIQDPQNFWAGVARDLHGLSPGTRFLTIVVSLFTDGLMDHVLIYLIIV